MSNKQAMRDTAEALAARMRAGQISHTSALCVLLDLKHTWYTNPDNALHAMMEAMNILEGEVNT